MPPKKNRPYHYRPEMSGWSTMTIEQRAEVKKLINRQYYQENREKLMTRNRERARRLKGVEPTRPAPKLCEACGQPPNGKFTVLHADHCHATGAFRGWLCGACNFTLGHAYNDPKRLRALADYLEK